MSEDHFILSAFREQQENIRSIPILVASLGIASASAMACPKGQHPYGGTGPHHKGGFCGY